MSELPELQETLPGKTPAHRTLLRPRAVICHIHESDRLLLPCLRTLYQTPSSRRILLRTEIDFLKTFFLKFEIFFLDLKICFRFFYFLKTGLYIGFSITIRIFFIPIHVSLMRSFRSLPERDQKKDCRIKKIKSPGTGANGPGFL